MTNLSCEASIFHCSDNQVLLSFHYVFGKAYMWSSIQKIIKTFTLNDRPGFWDWHKVPQIQLKDFV